MSIGVWQVTEEPTWSNGTAYCPILREKPCSVHAACVAEKEGPVLPNQSSGFSKEAEDRDF